MQASIEYILQLLGEHAVKVALLEAEVKRLQEELARKEQSS